MTVTIEKVTLINGERADQMRPDHILDILRRERSNVTDLRNDLPPGSAYRTEREAEHKENIKVLTALLDQYHTSKEN